MYKKGPNPGVWKLVEVLALVFPPALLIGFLIVVVPGEVFGEQREV